MIKRFAHARAAVRHSLVWAVLALLVGFAIGRRFDSLSGNPAAGRRYRAVARHEATGLETCYRCFHALDRWPAEPAAQVAACYVNEWGERVPVSIPVCGACTEHWDLAARKSALENWKDVMTERMREAERRGWVSAELARRKSAVYRNAFVTDGQPPSTTQRTRSDSAGASVPK